LFSTTCGKLLKTNEIFFSAPGGSFWFWKYPGEVTDPTKRWRTSGGPWSRSLGIDHYSGVVKNKFLLESTTCKDPLKTKEIFFRVKVAIRIWMRYTGSMKNEVLILNTVIVTLFDRQGILVEYREETSDRADAEYHIDFYKESFGRWFKNGTLSEGSWAALSWHGGDETRNLTDHIVEFWDSKEP
jgi:hypothetical protein